ncbi:MAG: SUMF1/EgtB/PvdO family nonheme iron enzyme [Candidatus Didemnitutus sp.]|nr:SUMF1/EgtB/PvdO family nonheme iron enzyme [Candidatus Didemnitutus sp.]
MRFDKFDHQDNMAPPAFQFGKKHWAAVGVVVLALAGVGLWRYHVSQDLAAEARRVVAVAQLDERRAAVAQLRVNEAAFTLTERVQRLDALLAAQRAMALARPSEMAALLPEIQATELEMEQLRVGAKLELSYLRETEAKTAMAAGDFATAENLWREAWELQREINRKLGDKRRDRERELRLENEVSRQQAEPLHAQMQQELDYATKATKDRNWARALEHYQVARDLQDRLNRDFSRSKFSDLSAVARLDAEIAALNADGIDERIRTLQQTARSLDTKGQETAAVEALVEATELQRTLNERFRTSRFVSMERLEQLDADRQSILARKPLQVVSEKYGQVRQHLQQRQIYQAQQLVREALEKIEEVATRWPKARNLDEDMRLQLSFLNVRSGDVAPVQDRVYENLLPLPGSAGVALLRVEVTQADFTRLMSTNPSRTPGRTLPVESVTFSEAQEFCRRLGWLLGFRVRLPREAEMRAAASDGVEFTDIVGGVAEWLGREERDSASAPVLDADGSTITRVPLTERSRTRGFRVAVEIDLSRSATKR